MRFLAWDHCGKAGYLLERMRQAGHESADTLEDADLVLLDCDWAWAHPRPMLVEQAAAAGVKVALYPHGGMPTVWVYDGLTEPNPGVDLRLEHGEGSVQAADGLGLELDQKACGWLYSPTHPFEPVAEPRRVLFAPQHPNMDTIEQVNGHDPGPPLNQHVYKQLLDLECELVVSLVGPPYRNGVWQHPHARFVFNPNMLLAESYQQIMAADVVVAAGTVAALAVACGKPVVTVGQAQQDYSDWVEGEYVHADHPEVYDDLFRYPLDAGDGDLHDLIQHACEGNDQTAAWRDAFVGDDGTAQAVRLLEKLAGGPDRSDPRHAIIGGVTARATMRMES